MKAFTKIIITIILILFFVSILSLIIYQNFPGNPIELHAKINNAFSSKSFNISVQQFYPNTKFNHNNLTYKIDSNCPENKRKRIVKAFELVSKEVIFINFSESSGETDIEVICEPSDYTIKNKIEDNSSDEREFSVAGEGGGREIINTQRYNIIAMGVIYLYDNPDFIECNWPNIEIHELMHVLGFNHSSNKESLMYPYLESCEQKLDNSIIEELKRIYSEPNLPDIYFENITVIKKGRYLDFNLTIKNSGSTDAEKASYTIVEDSNIIKTEELGSLKYGEGIIVRVTNFRLAKRSSKKIEIFLDYFDKIEEIDEKNNRANLIYPETKNS